MAPALHGLQSGTGETRYIFSQTRPSDLIRSLWSGSLNPLLQIDWALFRGKIYKETWRNVGMFEQS